MDIYLDHGGAYGNLGDEAMLTNAARRIRECIGSVRFIIPREEGAPLPDVGPCVEIPSPNTKIAALGMGLVRIGPLRRFLEQFRYYPILRRMRKMVVGNRALSPWNTLLEHVENAAAVYLVGAANLNDFARYSCLLPRYLLVEQAHQLGVPVVVSSQTVGPLKLPWTRQAVYDMWRRAHFFSVRDGGVSHALLASMGIDPHSAPIVGDEALTLPGCNMGVVKRFLLSVGVDPSRPFALFHFRATDYLRSTKRHLSKLAAAIDMARVDERILFLPMSYWRHSGEDEQVGATIRSILAKPEEFVV